MSKILKDVVAGTPLDCIFIGVTDNGTIANSEVRFTVFGLEGHFEDVQGYPLTMLNGIPVISCMTGGYERVFEGDVLVYQYRVTDPAVAGGASVDYPIRFSRAEFDALFTVKGEGWSNEKNGFACLKRSGMPKQKIYDSSVSLLDENFVNINDGTDETAPFILQKDSNLKTYISSGSYIVEYILGSLIIKKVILASVFNTSYVDLNLGRAAKK